MRLDRLPADQMINLFLHMFEQHVMEEKEVREARERVRAEMRKRFSLNPPDADFDDAALPQPSRASGPRPVKPYIPPTIPNDDSPNPFGLVEPPMR